MATLAAAAAAATAAAGIQFLFQSTARIRTVGGQSAVPSGTVGHITRKTSQNNRRQYDLIQARQSCLGSQEEDFHFKSALSRPTLRRTQCPLRWPLAVLLPEVNGPVGEFHHSSSPGAEVNTKVCSTSLASFCANCVQFSDAVSTAALQCRMKLQYKYTREF
jgi:hypothetical protein